MGRPLLVCLMLLLCGPAFPALFPGAAADPAPLPDLSPELYFFADGNETRGATAGTPVTIIVYVNNEGPGNVSSANLTLSVDGSLVTVVPVVFNFSGEGRFGAAYNWNTTAIAAGNHTVRADINDSAGDTDPSDNGADYKFTVGRRSAGLRLFLDVAIVEVVVTDTLPGIATLTGTAEATSLGGLGMNISLSAATDTGWATSVAPSSFSAGQDGRYTFTATVTVPQGSPATRIGKIVISAIGRTPDENLTATAEGLIKVRPYYRLMLNSTGASRTMDTGSQAFFTVRLTNTGNVVDSYEVEVSNLLDLVAKGWVVVLSANTLAKLSPDDSKTLSVSAQPPEDWTLGKSEATTIIIKVTSQGARDNGQNVSLSFSLTAREEGSYPAWYNTTTIGLAVVIPVAICAALFWIWRSKRKETGTAEDDGAGVILEDERKTGNAGDPDDL